LKKNIKYNKAEIENEARLSLERGRLTEALGRFILDRAEDVSYSAFITNGNNELRQALTDDAVMRVCDKFLDYYVEGKSAANLIISMIYSTMTNKIVSLKWRDVYGSRIKGNVMVYEDGEIKKKLVRYVKDDYASKKL
jgi:hypothetical protein